MEERRRTAVAAGLKILSLTWLWAHFALTLVYVMPPNPLRLAWSGPVDTYIGGFFWQNWGLFAPNPEHTSRFLLLRPLHVSGQEIPEVHAEEGWHDVTSLAVQAHQQNRFSAYERVSRAYTNPVRSLLGGSSQLDPWRESCRRGNEQSCRVFEEQYTALGRRSYQLLRRWVSSVALTDMGWSQASHVAVRVRAVGSVPWSRREAPQRDTTDMDLAVFVLDRGVRPNPLITPVAP